MITNTEEKILNVLTDNWQSTARITFDSGLCFYACKDALRKLQDEGKAEIKVYLSKNGKERNTWRKPQPEQKEESQHQAETQEVIC